MCTVDTDLLTETASVLNRTGRDLVNCCNSDCRSILNELERLASKYREYSSVINKINAIRSDINNILNSSRELEERNQSLVAGLRNAVQMYREGEREARAVVTQDKATVGGKTGSKISDKISTPLRNTSLQDIDIKSEADAIKYVTELEQNKEEIEMYTAILNNYRASGQGEPQWVLYKLEELGAPYGTVKKDSGEEALPGYTDVKGVAIRNEEEAKKYVKQVKQDAKDIEMYTTILNNYRASGQGEPQWVLDKLEELGVPYGIINRDTEVALPGYTDIKRVTIRNEEDAKKYVKQLEQNTKDIEMYTTILNNYRKSGQGEPQWVLDKLEELGAPYGIIKENRNEDHSYVEQLKSPEVLLMEERYKQYLDEQGVISMWDNVSNERIDKLYELSYTYWKNNVDGKGNLLDVPYKNAVDIELGKINTAVDYGVLEPESRTYKILMIHARVCTFDVETLSAMNAQYIKQNTVDNAFNYMELSVMDAYFNKIDTLYPEIAKRQATKIDEIDDIYLQNHRNGSKVLENVDEVIEGVETTFNKKVLEAMKNPNYKKYKVDCSEIAEHLYKASGEEGKIYRIVGKGEGGWMKGYEYGKVENYLYHEVYGDGKYIFDPRYSDVPVLKDDYFKALREINPDGFFVKELP